MSILSFLKRMVDDEHAQEGITPEVLQMVDLSIEYSPVIPFAGGNVDDAVDVRPWGFVGEDALPDQFEVQHPLVQGPVDQESLKIMRARYLLARDAYYGPIFHRLFHGPLDDDPAHETRASTSPSTANGD